jgi:hypothetical protein
MDSAITGFLGKTENIALILSFLMNCGLAWYVVFLTKEGREERIAERAARTDNANKVAGALERLADAVNNWRVDIVRNAP